MAYYYSALFRKEAYPVPYVLEYPEDTRIRGGFRTPQIQFFFKSDRSTAPLRRSRARCKAPGRRTAPAVRPAKNKKETVKDE